MSGQDCARGSGWGVFNAGRHETEPSAGAVDSRRADDFVPTYMSRENYDVCIAEKELVIVEGAPHAIARLADREKRKRRFCAF